MATLGFIGLGVMGGPMATHLVEDGHDVTVFDLDDDAVARVESAGATAASTARGVAEAAEVVFLSLPAPADVESVVAELEPGFASGDVLVDTTTSTPETTEGIAARLGERGVTVLGAPVSGGRSGSEAATLSIMVGGDRSTHEACVPLFEAFAADVFYVGESPGHGHAIKLLNNYLSFTGLVAASEATLLGQQVGLDIETMCDVFSASSGRNAATEDKLPNQVATGAFDNGFPLRLMEKDIRLLSAFAEDNETPMLLANVVRNLVGYARTREGPDGDMTDVYRVLEGLMVRE